MRIAAVVLAVSARLALPGGAAASAYCGKIDTLAGAKLDVISEEIFCRPARRVMKAYFDRVRDGGCGRTCSVLDFKCVRGRNPDRLGTAPNVTCSGPRHARVYADDLG